MTRLNTPEGQFTFRRLEEVRRYRLRLAVLLLMAFASFVVMYAVK